MGLCALSQLVKHCKREAIEYLMWRRISWLQEEVEKKKKLLLKINQKMFSLSSLYILNIILVLSGGHPATSLGLGPEKIRADGI